MSSLPAMSSKRLDSALLALRLVTGSNLKNGFLIPTGFEFALAGSLWPAPDTSRSTR